MFQVQIDAQCADTFIEALPEEADATEFTVEELIGQLLLEHFDEVVVDEVTINFSPLTGRTVPLHHSSPRPLPGEVLFILSRRTGASDTCSGGEDEFVPGGTFWDGVCRTGNHWPSPLQRCRSMMGGHAAEVPAHNF